VKDGKYTAKLTNVNLAYFFAGGSLSIQLNATQSGAGNDTLFVYLNVPTTDSLIKIPINSTPNNALRLFASSVKAYPNPCVAGGVLTLSVTESSLRAVWQDVSGREVSTGKVEGGKLFVPQTLRSGLYFLRLEGVSARGYLKIQVD
jgi:hypothetical protein